MFRDLVARAFVMDKNIDPERARPPENNWQKAYHHAYQYAHHHGHGNFFHELRKQKQRNQKNGDVKRKTYVHGPEIIARFRFKGLAAAIATLVHVGKFNAV